MTSEEAKRHQQLMDFMTSFRSSMETNMKENNDKLDVKIDNVGKEVKEINGRLTKHENDEKRVLNRMEARLTMLEKEMKKTNLNKQNREKFIEEKEERKEEKVTEKKDTNADEEKQAKKDKEVKRSKFSRVEIAQEDLHDDSAEFADIHKFKSTWAKGLQNELDEAAGSGGMDNWEHSASGKDIEDSNIFEILPKKPVAPKIRKPVNVKNWFGNDKIVTSDSSSDNSDDESWNKIEREKMNKIKIKKKKEQNKEKMRQVAMKARNMVGVGPVDMKSVDKMIAEKDMTRPAAEAKMVKDFLKNYLDFDNEDLETIKIMETKPSAANDIIYFAVEDPDHIKEIYHRRAVSENDELIICDYIPPHFYERYMAISRRATELRANDNTLKTQQRWGMRDVEILTKVRGTQDFQKVKLTDFMGDTELPDFDAKKVWKSARSTGLKRKPFARSKQPDLPSSWKKSVSPATSGQGITRQHSEESLNRLKASKARKTEHRVDEVQEDMDTEGGSGSGSGSDSSDEQI